MSGGWTPIPDELLDKLFKSTSTGKRDRKSALTLYLLSKTCRKDGWQGLKPGQIRVTESQVSEILRVSRGRAHEILSAVIAESGIDRAPDGILSWTGAGNGAGNVTEKPLKTLGENEITGAGNGAETEAVSITILQDYECIPPSKIQNPPSEIQSLVSKILQEHRSQLHQPGKPSQSIPNTSRKKLTERVTTYLKRESVSPESLLLAYQRYLDFCFDRNVFIKAPENAISGGYIDEFIV